MFTGIIQAIGSIDKIVTRTDDNILNIHTDNLGLSDVNIGDSIAVNGVCLTAVCLADDFFTAHVSKATLAVTTGLNQIGPVNLEKALTLSDRLGGHLVSGHVDGIGIVEKFEPVGDCWELVIKAQHAISKYIAKKGSICVNGVSLTVNAIHVDSFSMNIIPHTISHTTIQYLKIGSQVNLEIDLIARYVERMQEWSQQESN